MVLLRADKRKRLPRLTFPPTILKLCATCNLQSLEEITEKPLSGCPEEHRT